MSEVIAAGLTAVVALLTGWWAHTRARHAQAKDLELAHRKAELREEELEQSRINTINQAYDDIVGQLRSEVDRLIDSRSADRIRWEEKEARLVAKVEELQAEITTMAERMRAMEAELSRVEKRRGYIDNREDPE